MTPKTPKNQKIKKFKKSIKKALNQKSLENKLQLKLKNIKIDIFENFKKSKMTPKTPKSQKFKKSKSPIRRPQIKKFNK